MMDEVKAPQERHLVREDVPDVDGIVEADYRNDVARQRADGQELRQAGPVSTILPRCAHGDGTFHEARDPDAE